MTDVMGRTFWACKRLKSHKGMDGRWEVFNEQDAILISSLTRGGLHAPCLDFDFPGMVVPQTSFGGAPSWVHVMTCKALLPIFGTPRPWDKLHASLAEAGLVDLVDTDNSPITHYASLGGKPSVYVQSLVYKVPVRAIPSSNPYKHHFYIDAPITWAQYLPIIEALKDLALLEFNFAKFSIEREMTMLMKPGLKKSDLEARGVSIEENSDGTWNTSDLGGSASYGVGYCLHKNVTKGDEFSPDRCRDCFEAIYPKSIFQK